MTIKEIVSHWRLCAQDCGRIAEGFIRNDSSDRAWAASFMAAHYAALVWAYENDPELNRWTAMDNRLNEPMGCSDDSMDFMEMVGE